MAIFKEVVRGDGSGIAEYYRVQDGKVMNVDYSMVTNKPTLNGVTLSGDLTMEDFGMDIEGAVETLTGEEISKLKKDDNKIVLCTTDYLYTDSEGLPIQTERGSVYEIYNGIIVDKISTGGSGGGGGSSNPRSNFTSPVSELEQKVSINSKVSLSYKFVTTAIPNTGVAQLYIGSILKGTKAVTSGNTYSFDVTPYVKEGTNYFTIKTKDEYGAEKELNFMVNAIQLGIRSTFDSGMVLSPDFDYIYTLTGSGEKEVHFVIDGEETVELQTATGVPIRKSFTGLEHGVHTLSVYTAAVLDTETLLSNQLDYKIMVAEPNNSECLALSSFDTTEITEGTILNIDYMFYDPANPTPTVQLLINDELISSAQIDRTRKTWRVSQYPIGEIKFSIVLNDSCRIDKTVLINELDIKLEAVTDNLSLYLTAGNRSNDEVSDSRSTWKYNDIEAELTDFKWTTDGWTGDALKFKGDAHGYIPYNIFGTDIRATGKTIEFEFTTHRAFDNNSLLISCKEGKKGFEIYQNYCQMSSEQTSITSKYNLNSRIRISIVIEGLSSNRLIKTYVNGVLSGLTQYAATDNFQHVSDVGITINPNKEEIDIHTIRIYDRELTSMEVLHNYLYDMNDIETKIQMFTNNLILDDYGNVSYVKLKNLLPTLIITGELPQSKGDKRTVSCSYEDVKNTEYNFDYENCIIDVQGTSSIYYPRKNWKIKLPEKIKFHKDAIEENTFCFKTDYMETSHSHNIGTAILANSLPKELFPTRQENELVRDTMYGFPCVIFHREKMEDTPVFYGTFMFNNDKSNSDTLGLTTEKSESWEFCNNTSDHCLFKTNNFSADAKPEENLEARYPDKNTDYTNIKKLYDWIVSCKDDVNKFKEEFNQHLNLEYCLNYQVLMEFAMLTDSRAKNMFLDTVDGEIWYPRFYDMDTCWGLNNEGVLSYSYDVDIHDTYGSGYVWNDRGQSVLWNLFEEAFAEEIKNKYHELRKEKLTYDNLMQIYVTDISKKFPKASYNEDAYFKYVLPLLQSNDSTYIHAAQGDREEHFKYILENRIKYLDSKYEYGDYNISYATMRLYTKKADFDITTYSTEFVNIKFGSTVKGERCPAGVITRITSPENLEFNDTETIIYGADSIASLGDLSDKYPGTVDITRCLNLQELIIGSTSRTNLNLKSLSLGNNTMLRKIDLRNCPNLTGELDLSSCTDLREVYLTGTGITSVTLPDTGSVEILHLPNSISTLKLHNQHIKTLQFEGFNNIQTVDISNTIIDNYTLQDILLSCSNLARLNVRFDDTVESLPIEIMKLYTTSLHGIDPNGLNTQYPNLIGDITVTVQKYHTELEADEYETEKELFEQAYPNLNINYQLIDDYLAFYGYKTTINESTSYPLGYYWEYTTTESDIEFYGVWMKSYTAGPEILVFPTSYKKKPVKILSTGGNINPGSAYKLEGSSVPTMTSGSSSAYLRSSTVKAIIIPTTYERSHRSLSLGQCPKLITISCVWDELYANLNNSYNLLSLGDVSECTKLATTSVVSDYNSSYPNRPAYNLFGSIFIPNLKYIEYSSSYQSTNPIAMSAFMPLILKDIDWSKLLKIEMPLMCMPGKKGKNVSVSNPEDYLKTQYPFTMSTQLRDYMAKQIDNYKPTSNGKISNGTIEGVDFGETVFNIGEYKIGNLPLIRRNIKAKSYTGTEDITTFNFKDGYDYKFVFGPLYASEETTLNFPGVTDLTANTYYDRETILIGDVNFNFPNAQRFNPDFFNYYISNPKGKIYLPDGIKLTMPSSMTPNYGMVTALFSFKWVDDTIPLIDCSEVTGNTGVNGWIKDCSLSGIKKVKGFKDLGKSYPLNASANSTSYCVCGKYGAGYSGGSAYFPVLDDESWINILDNLYDIASRGVATQTVYMYHSYKNISTNPDLAAAAERARAKGWTLRAE